MEDRTPVAEPGRDPERDAWIANFYTENHLAYEVFPDEVASPEQLRFIVYMGDELHYYPCADEVFEAIIERRADERLPLAYLEVWQRLEPLVRSVVEDDYRRRFLLSLLRTKFRHETASLVILPGRLEKRLLQIFTRISEIDRPLAAEKERRNRRVRRLLDSEAFRRALNDPEGLDAGAGEGLSDLERRILLLQVRRLLALAGRPEIWTLDTPPSEADLRAWMAAPLEGEGWGWLCARLDEWRRPGPRRYLLWMGSSAGEVLLDLEVIRLLIRMGVKVILAVKQAFYYEAVTLADVLEDPYLEEALRDAEVVTDPRISKKALLEKLKSDKMLFVISDGTQERFNPLLTSVTFARAFKEVDAVVNRDGGDAACLLRSRFRFTRDILNVFGAGPGRVRLEVKPRHPAAVRFSEADLAAKAQALIDQLAVQKRRGKSIMFYSAIVGSIPNQLATAKRVLGVFVRHLRERQEGVVVINPAEHFEPGMDGDDLMYMWEIVQRSGLIDIWRFQTVEDIEKAFELMGEKVPPEWVGKDATYSTGCTIEMRIALEVQKHHPEMQIIGPPWEKFLRRTEYGVGKYYDRALAGA